MSRHTQGPWKRAHSVIVAAKTDEDGDPIVIAVPFGVNQRNFPRGLDAYSVPPKNEAEGNAALLTAAPEMYEALEFLIKNCTAESFSPWAEALKKSRAAIAKAEGK